LPVWLIVTLVVAAALIVGAWAEAKFTIIIAELQAIRQDLDKLWSDRTEEEVIGVVEEESDAAPEG
jgi:hypothetical protein